MNSIFLQEDILDCFKNHVYITDYDKLKKVSSKYRRYFDLKHLIDSKKYEDIMVIKGCSIDILAIIITQHIIKKYTCEENKDITAQIVKHKNKFSLSPTNKSHYILKSLLNLYYNCYNNNYQGIIMCLWVFQDICNKKLQPNNFEYFIQPVLSYVEDIQTEKMSENFDVDIDEYDENVSVKMLIRMNLYIYLSIIMKRFKIIITDNLQIKLNALIIDGLNTNLQENVLDYIDFNINSLAFPNYYINYVKYVCNNILL
jgi:hypothetical protein